MTRKDYELIAGAMASDAVAAHDAEMRRSLAHEPARRLKSANPRFDRGRFLAACGFAGSNA